MNKFLNLEDYLVVFFGYKISLIIINHYFYEDYKPIVNKEISKAYKKCSD